MEMSFDSRIKGVVACELVRMLLTDAGYTVIRNGIEELIPEIQTMSKLAYKKLDISDAIRTSPDLFLKDGNGKAFHIEVKYRSTWKRKDRVDLHREVIGQVKIWSPFYLVLVLGKIESESSSILDHLRVMRLHPDAGGNYVLHQITIGDKTIDAPLREAEWEDLMAFDAVFPGTGAPKQGNASLKLIRALVE